jgi:chitinase
MKTPLSSLRFLIGALLLAASPLHAQSKIVAYVPNWIDLKTFAPQIDYAKLTHLNIAFENPKDAKGTLSFHSDNEQLITEAHAHGVKILVSIGGGTASENKDMRARYAALISPAKRAKFVAQIVAYVSAHDFDGLDVDLEGPAINRHYGAFIQDLAAALQPQHKLLTAALSQGYGGKNVPAAALAHFDFVNVMAYDATGPWQPKSPGQHSSLEFAQNNVDYWLQRGLPKAQLVLGIPFYGWGFGKAFRQKEYSYAELLKQHPAAAGVDEIGETVWYNGVPTVQAKAALVLEQGLGGVMIWSLDSDAKGRHSLLSVLHEALKSGK